MAVKKLWGGLLKFQNEMGYNMKNSKIILHIPHSSTFIPQEIREDIILSDQELQDELLKTTDRYVDELFEVEGVNIHKSQYSRLVFDPERFRDDDLESMSKAGMGAVYCKTCKGSTIRKLDPEYRECILKKYYDPYHEEFERKVRTIIKDYNECVIIDCHSFSSTKQEHELVNDEERPEICIGTDEFHTPQSLAVFTGDFFKGKGFSCKFNIPHAGSIVPIPFYNKDKKCTSIMIEINRKIYMNEENGKKLDTFEQLKKVIEEYIFNVTNMSF